VPSLAELLSQGAGNAWLFIPSAILLGALHGLEPGHSKTMMAAFIVAIRGRVAPEASGAGSFLTAIASAIGQPRFTVLEVR
jgi:ABC-type nickel/cobalt efflux system permease component RcnA